MLKRIEIKNAFKHPNTVIDFQTGLTAIIGPNESGKSMIFELVSFALFGTVALRGAADDYKKMSVTLDFEVMDKAYRVSRAGSKVLLYVNGQELATGTKVVNPKIIEILGYDYKVFTIANCANQDELTKLGTMKPTERKQMVDNVIGLTILDKLTASIAAKISGLNGEVEYLRMNTIVPAEPVKPEHYRPAGELQKIINETSILEQRHSYLAAWLNTTLPQPIMPTDPGFGSLDDLIAKNNEMSVKISRSRDLENQLARYTEPTLTPDQIAALKTQWQKVDSLSDLQHKHSRLSLKPTFSRQELDAFAAQADMAHKWEQKEKLLAAGEHECPSCHHHWPVASDQLAAYEGISATSMPSYIPSPRDYAAVEAYNAETATRVDLEAQIAAFGTLEVPKVSKDQIAVQERSLADYEVIQKARKELAEIRLFFAAGQPDYSQMISARQRYDQELAAYNQGVITYNQWVADWQKNKTEFDQLVNVPAQMQALRNLMTSVAVYDNNYMHYQTALAAYNQKVQDIQTKSILLNQYEKARAAMKEARSTVKRYLVPSLNRVSSALLTQMTGGARSSIEVTEDFEIFVDGQPLATLSGSGKAVANLAIRIALGQVLIAKKFSVFMADEIDGSMDADRAEFTSECLRRLTKNVKQLLLISHKRPEADNYIELGR